MMRSSGAPRSPRGREPIVFAREEISSRTGNIILWEDCRTSLGSTGRIRADSPSRIRGDSPSRSQGHRSVSPVRQGGGGILPLAPGNGTVNGGISPLSLADLRTNPAAQRSGIDFRLDENPRINAAPRSGINLVLDENPRIGSAMPKYEENGFDLKLGSTARTVAPQPAALGSPVSYTQSQGGFSVGTTSSSVATGAPSWSSQGNDVPDDGSWDPEARPPPGGWPKALAKVEKAGLTRFTKAQHSLHARAVREIYAGKKSSCWMWFCFPTPPFMANGKEIGSARNRMYAIRSDQEAREFLKFESDGVNLRNNYLEAVTAVRDKLKEGSSAKSIFGFIDEPKLSSSVTYFERISRGLDEELNTVLLEVKNLLSEEDGAKPKESAAPRPRSAPPIAADTLNNLTSTAGAEAAPQAATQKQANASRSKSPTPSAANYLQYKKKPTDAVAPHFRSDDRAKAWEQDNPHVREHSKPDPMAFKKQSRSPTGRSNKKATSAVAPKLRSDKRHDEWGDRHQDLREQHDTLHADHNKVRKELRQQKNLNEETVLNNAKKTTVARDPRLRSDARKDVRDQHYEELRQQHDEQHSDLVAVRREMHKPLLDAKTLERNHTNVTAAVAPKLKSDARSEECPRE